MVEERSSWPEREARDRWRELDAERALGGWKKCDFAPTLTSSFGGSVVSITKETGLTVPVWVVDEAVADISWVWNAK